MLNQVYTPPARHFSQLLVFLSILNSSEIHRKIASPVKRSWADFGAPSRSQRGLKITPSRINWRPDPPKIWKNTVFDLSRKTHRKLLPESMRFHGPEPRFYWKTSSFVSFSLLRKSQKKHAWGHPKSHAFSTKSAPEAPSVRFILPFWPDRKIVDFS